MTYSTIFSVEAGDDFVELPYPVAPFPLTSEHHQAASGFRDIPAEYRWSSYTQALTILGFYEWLRDREPSFTLDPHPLSYVHPLYSQHIDAVLHLPVNGFEVCLLPSLSFSEDTVAVPRVVVDCLEFTDDLYVIVALDESLEAIAIQGFLNYQELTQLIAQSCPTQSLDWNYYLPRDRFHLDPDTLLLYLHCLAPEAIHRPIPTSDDGAALANYQSILQARLPLVQNRPLWQVFSWEEGQMFWRAPELLQWLETNRSQHPETAKNHLSDLFKLLIEPAIDLTVWVKHQVEDCQNLINGSGWQLIPETAFRRHLPLSPVTDLSALLRQIEQEVGVKVPADAGRAYQDLNFPPGEQSRLAVRLYAITWCLSYEESWTLLLILGSSSREPLPSNLGWRISDQSSILVEETVSLDHPSSYLFTQVIGSYDEKFLVTLFSGSEKTMSLPPFSFPW